MEELCSAQSVLSDETLFFYSFAWVKKIRKYGIEIICSFCHMTIGKRVYQPLEQWFFRTESSMFALQMSFNLRHPEGSYLLHSAFICTHFPKLPENQVSHIICSSA